MSSPVASIATRRRRRESIDRAIEARRALAPRSGSGRAWINGREVGGQNPRYAHLHRSYD